VRVYISCKEKKNGDHIINGRLGEITLPNKGAENDFNKGLFYERNENYSAARDFFLRADEESPNTPIILNDLGISFDQTSDALQGFKCFKNALHIDSNYIRTYINYGYSLNNNHRFNEAETIFRQGLSKQSFPSFERSALYCNLADTYYHRNQPDTALSFPPRSSPAAEDHALSGHVSLSRSLELPLSEQKEQICI
jgi:tetratricopeptide (TPR) repeat protein